MATKDYDKTLTRLLGILTKLANQDLPTTKELAQEYNVSVRTIQLDINRRLYNYPIVKRSDHRYMFEYGFTLKDVSLTNDELVFLNLALSQFEDVDDIDKVTESIYKKLIHQKVRSPYYIKQDDIEDLDIDSPLISQLEEYITAQDIVQIEFTNTTKELELYKIAAFDGFWYLFAKDLEDNKTKTFQLSQIKKIVLLEKKHTTSVEEIEKILEHVHSAFFEDGNLFRVVIKVYPEVAIYFKNRKFLESQKIEKEHTDGSLEVSFEVTNDEDIDNIIKSWLPHVEILKPQSFREKLLYELETYLKNIQTK